MHLQRFPAIARLISPSVGFGFSESKALAESIIPDVQKPHCMAPLSTKSTHSDKPCRYALEVPTGTFSKYNINVGSRLKLKNNVIFIEK